MHFFTHRVSLLCPGKKGQGGEKGAAQNYQNCGVVVAWNDKRMTRNGLYLGKVRILHKSMNLI